MKSLPRLTIVVGANGSGTSTLFDVFSFLKDALAQNVAVARRGGFRELVSRGAKGPIGITVKFRESGGRLATYQLDIGEDKGRPVVEREILNFRRGKHGQPWHFVDFSRGKGTAITNESAHSPDFLNGAQLEEIYWLVKKDGFTEIRRASESELLRSLTDVGDLPGALWKQGLFEGVGL